MKTITLCIVLLLTGCVPTGYTYFPNTSRLFNSSTPYYTSSQSMHQRNIEGEMIQQTSIMQKQLDNQERMLFDQRMQQSRNRVNRYTTRRIPTPITVPPTSPYTTPQTTTFKAGGLLKR